MLSKVRSRAGWLVAGVLLVQGGFAALAAQDAPIKIAVVDLDRVIAQSSAGQELQAKLEKFRQDVQSEGESMQGQANELRQRAVEGGQSLSQDKLAELQKSYEDKLIELRRFRDDKQREGEKMQQEGLRLIEKQLEPVFKQIRDEKGYDLILNNVPGIVVMANERVDITRDIVERLNTSGG